MIKKGFTLVEVMIASTIMAMILLVGIGIISAVNRTIFDGQTETRGRTNLSDNIYYLTRELQSAEAVLVSADGKLLKIKQLGSSDYSLIYEIRKDYPVSAFCFKDKKMFAIDYDKSQFNIDGTSIVLTLAILKSETAPNQTPQVTKFYVTPRCETAILGG